MRIFPYLSRDVVAVLHVRRAGWLSAQQYGMLLLEQAKAHGATLIEDRVVGVGTAAGRVERVHLASGSEIQTGVFVNAAGPLLAEVGQMLGLSLPVHHELHMKASIIDTSVVVGRDAPLLIDVDPQFLCWTDEERAWLLDDEDTRWLLDELPSGAHVRPEGAGDADSILMLWDTRTHRVDPVLPAPADVMYPEVAVRLGTVPGADAETLSGQRLLHQDGGKPSSGLSAGGSRGISLWGHVRVWDYGRGRVRRTARRPDCGKRPASVCACFRSPPLPGCRLPGCVGLLGRQLAALTEKNGRVGII